MGDYNHPPVLEERPPELLVTIVNDGSRFLISYGWYILVPCIVLFILWPRLQKYLDIQYERWLNQKYSERCHKDPDWFHSRTQSMAKARMHLQEKQDKKVKEHQRMLKEKEEKKREELRALYMSGDTLHHGKNNSFKPEYNALSSNPDDRYRPRRRKCCPNGGCG